MNIKTLSLIAAALLLGPVAAWAQEDSTAESTIRLMGAAEATLPEAVTKEISLPAAVTEDTDAVSEAKAAFGLETANTNRLRREDGLLQADDARENSAEMAGDAQDNLESRGRSEDRPEPPTDPGPPGD